MWRLGSRPRKEMAAVNKGFCLLSLMHHGKNLGITGRYGDLQKLGMRILKNPPILIFVNEINTLRKSRR